MFDYAIQNGYHHKNFVEMLPDVRRIKRYRLPTVFTVDEIEKVLSLVDRENPLGKRNYAILLLVTKFGLRIGDVRSLQFKNIDWQNKVISIIQNKTRVPLDLPLFDDVGWAIIDYLQYGRTKTDCQCIFVRHIAPYNEVTGNFRQIVLKYIQRAGIKISTTKPIGMHSFRHSLATTMLKKGAKYTDVASILGHVVPESSHTYISLDEEQLRQCSLEVNF
jgi:site-specific recombinase XerD